MDGFSINDAAISLGDIKKLRNIGVKTILWFLGSSALTCTIVLVIANTIQPVHGVTFAGAASDMTVNELSGPYDTILDLFPVNPFASNSPLTTPKTCSTWPEQMISCIQFLWSLPSEAPELGRAWR